MSSLFSTSLEQLPASRVARSVCKGHLFTSCQLIRKQFVLRIAIKLSNNLANQQRTQLCTAIHCPPHVEHNPSCGSPSCTMARTEVEFVRLPSFERKLCADMSSTSSALYKAMIELEWVSFDHRCAVAATVTILCGIYQTIELSQTYYAACLSVIEPLHPTGNEDEGIAQLLAKAVNRNWGYNIDQTVGHHFARQHERLCSCSGTTRRTPDGNIQKKRGLHER